VLQESMIERLGSNRSIALDIRLIAATNRDPHEAVQRGKLREDLYYRINVVGIALPPLREHSEDIAGLVEHFVLKHGGSLAQATLRPNVLLRLSQYAWPGNVRELENMVERALILSGGGALGEEHFLLQTRVASTTAASAVEAPGMPLIEPLNQAVDTLEARLIDAALAQTNGNKARAAALLDISERTLWYKLKKFRPDQADS
jgi:two-component system response regulator AtoC